jgi:hypothetical protein
MKLPLVAILKVVDLAFGIAQFVDGLLTRRKPKPRHGDLVTPRVDRGAKTVVLKRRPPVPPTNPRD